MTEKQLQQMSTLMDGLINLVGTINPTVEVAPVAEPAADAPVAEPAGTETDAHQPVTPAQYDAALKKLQEEKEEIGDVEFVEKIKQLRRKHGCL